ncbi:unnamed protein product [Jaminaea pallidilutea]
MKRPAFLSLVPLLCFFHAAWAASVTRYFPRQSAKDDAAAVVAVETISAGKELQTKHAVELSGLFFGCLLSLFFGGAVALQSYNYMSKYGRRGADKLPVQILVGFLLILSVISDGVLLYRLYDVYVLHFGDPIFPLLTIGWEVAINYVCIACMIFAVQVYFAHRVWTASRHSIWVLLVFGSLTLFTLLAGITAAALSLQAGSSANVRAEVLTHFAAGSPPWRWAVVFTLWLVIVATTDLILCACLTWQLSRMKSPFFSTRHAIARLVTLAVETCAVNVGFSLGAAGLFLSVPSQFHFLILFAPLGQIATFCLIANLMVRPSIAKELAQDMNMGPERRNIEDFASVAPVSIAKPVLKRIMKREARKKPLEVQMTTVVQQNTSRDEDAHEMWADVNTKQRRGGRRTSNEDASSEGANSSESTTGSPGPSKKDWNNGEPSRWLVHKQRPSLSDDGQSRYRLETCRPPALRKASYEQFLAQAAPNPANTGKPLHTAAAAVAAAIGEEMVGPQHPSESSRPHPTVNAPNRTAKKGPVSFAKETLRGSKHPNSSRDSSLPMPLASISPPRPVHPYAIAAEQQRSPSLASAGHRMISSSSPEKLADQEPIPKDSALGVHMASNGAASSVKAQHSTETSPQPPSRPLRPLRSSECGEARLLTDPPSVLAAPPRVAQGTVPRHNAFSRSPQPRANARLSHSDRKLSDDHPLSTTEEPQETLQSNTCDDDHRRATGRGHGSDFRTVDGDSDTESENSGRRSASIEMCSDEYQPRRSISEIRRAMAATTVDLV